MSAVTHRTRDGADAGARRPRRRRPAAARPRVGSAGRPGDPVRPRLVAEPPVLGEAVRERAGGPVPARGVRPARPRHVGGATRARALHRRRAVGGRPRRHHRRSCAWSGPCSSGGRTAPSRSATTSAATARSGSGRSSSSRARSSSARRPSAPSSAPGSSTTSSMRRPTTCRPASAPCAPSCAPAWSSRSRTMTSSRRVLERRRAGSDPRPPRRAGARLRRRAPRARAAAARVAGSGRHGRAAGDGRARLATCPTAEASWYDGVGHAPHLEEPERFNRELAELTRRVRA